MHRLTDVKSGRDKREDGMKRHGMIVIACLMLATPAAAKQGGQGYGKEHGASQAGQGAIQTSSPRPPGLSKRGKTPPGLEKQGKTRAGWTKGKKTGWDATPGAATTNTAPSAKHPFKPPREHGGPAGQ